MNNESKYKTILYKIQDRMLLGSIYDNVMKKTKYKDSKLSFLYNVMVAQKHRMLYYKKLKRKYFERCTQNREWENLPKEYNTDVIWFSWLQGIDNAPILVKRCYESICNQFPDKKIIVIDESNMFDYVDIPEFIIKKWKDGIIGNAHFSDILRLELLIKHGGCWIDSTVLCTDGAIMKQIEKYPLFMYSFFYFGFNPEIMELNNWFVSSTTNSNILCLMREFLYTYWKENNRAVDYFVFHLFLTMAVEYYNEEYFNIPIVSQAQAHVLARYIRFPYDENVYEMCKLNSGIHKLNTRFVDVFDLKPGSFYDVLINQGKI